MSAAAPTVPDDAPRWPALIPILIIGIPVMLNAPYTHKEIGEVAGRHPRLRIIIDHLGARTTQKDDLLKVAAESTTGSPSPSPGRSRAIASRSPTASVTRRRGSTWRLAAAVASAGVIASMRGTYSAK